MKRTWMRHAAAVTILASALALAAPAQALGWREWTPASDLVHAAWSWLASLWAAPQETESQDGTGPVWQKGGGCSDPLGQPVCQNQSVTTGADAGGG